MNKQNPLKLPHRFSLIKKRRIEREQTKTRIGRTLQLMLLGLAAVVSLALVAFTFFGVYTWLQISEGLPSAAKLPALLNPADGLLLEPTRFYDRTGTQELFSLGADLPHSYFYVNPEAPDHFAPQMIQAVVALLEPEFWRSPGFDRAELLNPQPTTIAERLVLNLLLENEAPDWRRALRMRVLAAQVVNEYGRIQVLEWYLNSAYFGQEAFGADYAARLFFEKSARELSLREIAVLLSLIDTPALNPVDAPAAALERSLEILDELAESDLIGDQEIETARAEMPQFASIDDLDSSPLDVFREYVLDQLEETIPFEKLARGGLKVITSLDVDLQQQLLCTAQIQVQRLTEESYESLSSQALTECSAAALLPTWFADEEMLEAVGAAGIVVDPQSGEILAWMEQMPEEEHITREPGSLLTPFSVLTAFTRSMSPSTLVWDIPPDEVLFDGYTNLDNEWHGPVRLRSAFANDYLYPLYQLTEQVGAANVWQLARTLGLDESLQIDQTAEILLHGGHVSMAEAAQAYSAFATNGKMYGRFSDASGQLELNAVLSVSDIDGRQVMLPAPADVKSVISEELSWLVHDMLQDDTVRRSELGVSNLLEIGRPVAAKIAGTSDRTQIWTAGYTPDQTTIIWLGSANSDSLDMRSAAGIWHAMMQYQTRDLAVSDWQQPASILTIEVCDPSGLLPTNACPRTVQEFFLQGNEPISYDNLYKTFEVNRETNKLATVFTPLELVDEKIFLIVPESAQQWADQQGLAQPPSDYDAILEPEALDGVEIVSPGLFDYIRGTVEIVGTASGEGLVSWQLRVGKGLNPQSWSQLGTANTTPVEEDVLAEWDTSSLDGLYVIELQVLRENNQLDRFVWQVSVDNQAPVVRILSPLNGLFDPGELEQVNFQIEVQDNTAVDHVEWMLDGGFMGETWLTPHIMPWEVETGQHTLEVIAFDRAGNESEASVINFEIIQPE